MDGYFSVRVHHGGTFENIHGDIDYRDGQTTIWDNCDIDRWSFFEMKDGLAEMGHTGNYDMWFAQPNARLEDTLKPIVDDRGAMELGKIGLAFEILQLPSNEPPPPLSSKGEGDNDDRDEDNDGGDDNDDTDDGVEDSDDGNEPPPPPEPYTVRLSDDDGSDYESDDDTDADSAADIRFNDSEEEDIENDFFDSDDGAQEQRTKKRMDNPAVQPEPNSAFGAEDCAFGAQDSDEDNVAVPTGPSSSKVRGLSDEEYQSEELGSCEERSDSSDEEVVKRNFPRWREPRDWEDYKFELGTIFGTKQEFINAVKTFGVFNGRGVKFAKNDKKRWIAAMIEKKIRRNPKYRIKSIVELAQEKWNMILTKGKARQAKLRALEKINGSNAEQFKRLHDYCHELIRSNPGSTVKLATVDAPTGLLPAINELLPNVEQRFCVRHLYNNFRKKYPGQTLKELLWKAAKATYPAEWERTMLEIKAVNEDAFKHLMQVPPRHWSKSRFKTTQRCDALLNNMSETFNSVIVDVREKPIVSMIEDIRMYLMEKWTVNRTKIERHRGSILPRIKKRLEIQIAQAGKWVPRWSGEEKFEVTSVYRHDEKYVVDLQKEECSCRLWMLTGIPCCHGVSAIHFMRRNPEDLIPGCFRKEQYVECYRHIIHPTNGKNMWPSTEYADVLPPDYRRLTGRPKKRRRKDTFEKDDNANKRKQARRRNKDIPDEHLPDEVTKTGQPQKCTLCGKNGHNRRKCPKLLASDAGTEPNTEPHDSAPNAETTASSSSSQRIINKNKCGRCGQLGHNRRKCPTGTSSGPEPSPSTQPAGGSSTPHPMPASTQPAGGSSTPQPVPSSTQPAGGSSTPQPVPASTQPAGTSTAPPPTPHAGASSQPTPLRSPMRTKTTARKKATPPVVRSFASKEGPATPTVLRPKTTPRKKTKPPPTNN
ncbi:putative transcription factor interactor and regulator CCHC(Zn) family [Senna tora]|uniref:Putative transcription factor interactor and regulator CCHC(Zn) family n=1 Tax=Senna tora TaxID=362788 RepID=A0A834XKE1_9FABA|nr:putative transcription factor interactor and regulator CCHC(Zn) family [Senna tora]